MAKLVLQIGAVTLSQLLDGCHVLLLEDFEDVGLIHNQQLTVGFLVADFFIELASSFILHVRIKHPVHDLGDV